MSNRLIPRNEFKYLITHKQAEWLCERLNHYMTFDPYTDENGSTPILSMYYDSPSLEFYQEKVAGIDFRNKIRMRVYDYDFNDGVPAFLEIKQRINDKVRKIRSYIPKFDRSLLEPEAWSFNNDFETDNFGILVERYNPKAACQVFYNRKSYIGLRDPDLRITFDSQLISLFPDETLNATLLNDSERHIIPDTLTILEIKSTSELPIWVYDLIKRMNIEQISIPKYVSGIEKLKICDDYSVHQGVYI